MVWPVIKVVSLPGINVYLEFFKERQWQTAMLHSLFLTAVSTITCTITAFVFAYTIATFKIPLKGLFSFVTVLPVVSPPFIVSLAYILLFGGQGLITKHLLNMNVNIYGWQGLWFVQTITFFPYAYAVIYGVIKSLPSNLENAAHNLGASRSNVFFKVVLPLCIPGIAGGALMAAINVLTDFGNPMMLGGNYSVLPTEAYLQIIGVFNLPKAAMLATMLLVPAAVFFGINKYFVSRRSYAIVTGRESQMERMSPNPVFKWSMFTLCLAMTLVILSVYIVIFYGAFTKLWGYDWSVSFANFKYVVLKNNEILNSLKFAAAAALLASVISMALAYLVQRKHVYINKLLDFLAIIPGAIPGVFLGLGFAIAFNQKPVLLTATPAIMILALTFWNIPNCYTATSAGLSQLGGSLEEASLNLGANSVKTYGKIILPLLWVPFLSSFVVAFLRSVTCLSVIIFIYSVNTVVGTISILNFVQNGDWGYAAAFTVVLISLAFLVLGIASLVLKRVNKSIKLI